MLDYRGNMVDGSRQLFCPKCKRRYSATVAICPVDSIALVHSLINAEFLDEDQRDEDITLLKVSGAKGEPFSASAKNHPTEISTFAPQYSAEPLHEFNQLLKNGGPKFPAFTENFDDEELKTKLDPPPLADDKSASVELPQGTAPRSKSGPEAFAHTMHAVDQSVREALAPGIKKSKSESLIGQELHGTYRLTRLLCEGPMSNIFEASHVRLTKKRLAIKMLNPKMETRPDAYARFRREAEIATDLGHPHIVDVLDFNITEDGHLYLVMEYLEGEDLAKRLDHVGHLPFSEICQILGQVGSGLQAAHDREIIHRDIKPGNIFLVASTEHTITTKILDFGISKIKHSESVVTHYNMIVGTPYYMSPEQARATDEVVDHTTDIFALGTIAYQMLTGEIPFYAPTLPGILDKVSNYEPTPVTQLAPQTTEEVQQVISKALHKKKEKRYQRIEHFTKELISALNKVKPLSPEILRQLLPDQANGSHDFYIPLAQEKDQKHKTRSRGFIGPTRPLPLFDFEHQRGSERPHGPGDLLFPPKPTEPSLPIDNPDRPATFDTIPFSIPPHFEDQKPTPDKSFDPLASTLHDSTQIDQPIDLAATPKDPQRFPETGHFKLAVTEAHPQQTQCTTDLDLAATVRSQELAPTASTVDPEPLSNKEEPLPDFLVAPPSRLEALSKQASMATTIPMNRVDFETAEDSDPSLLPTVLLENKLPLMEESTLAVRWSKIHPAPQKKRHQFWLYLAIALLLGSAVMIFFIIKGTNHRVQPSSAVPGRTQPSSLLVPSQCQPPQDRASDAPIRALVHQRNFRGSAEKTVGFDDVGASSHGLLRLKA